MKIVSELPSQYPSNTPLVLTIGNFDGFHIGHQAVIKRVIDLAQSKKKIASVLTFNNHPSQILRPQSPTPLLCTTSHKIRLLEQAGIDMTILINFTKEFSEQTPELFLEHLTQAFPISTIVLGSDAHIGKDRKGDRSTITALAHKLGIEVEYFADCLHHGKRISSSTIREHIYKGDFTEASKLLGRPYSIYAPVVKGSNRGVSLGYPTLNINVDELCCPPLGVYVVTLLDGKKKYPAVANLGFAPTFRDERKPILEVHVYDQRVDLQGHWVEIIFHRYIRAEKKFTNIEELKNQIAQDITFAKSYVV